MIENLTDDTFEQVVGQSTGYVLVDFWAPWCAPCRELGDVLEKVDQEFADRLKIFKIMISDETQTATKFGVRAIPTMILFKDGQYLQTKTGFMSKSDLEKWLEESIA